MRIALTEWLAPAANRRLRLALPLDFAGSAAEQLDLHVRLHATASGQVIPGTGLDGASIAMQGPDTDVSLHRDAFRATGGDRHRLDLSWAAAPGDSVLHGRTLHKTVDLAAPKRDEEAPAGFVAQRWARLRVDELMAQPELHRTEIAALGNRYGIVTPETSLIVLETLADYQRCELQPPPGPLRDAYDTAVRGAAAGKAAQSARHLESLVQRWHAVQAWWDKDFLKDEPVPQQTAAVDVAGALRLELAQARSAPVMAASSMAPPVSADAAPMAAPAQAPAREMAEAPRERSAVRVTGARAVPDSRDAFSELERTAGRAPSPSTIHIAVLAWSPDAAGMRRLADAAPDARYAVYLDQRLQASGSPAFFLDAAQVFASRGQRALALRVLSNLAELHLEDRGLLRVLAYRLQETGETAQAIRVLRRVADIAPDEPQSWRDLGLAQAAAGAWQPAVDALWTAASGTWDDRFGDIDLWVKDPHGEWVSCQQPLSRQGGRITRDVTNGYGPEVFSLKKAIPGVYEVRAKYFGSHRQALGNPTSVMMRLTTGFGTGAEKHRDVILRLEEARDEVLVGSFEVR